MLYLYMNLNKLALFFLVLPAQATAIAPPSCLSILEPFGIDPLSKHAGEDDSGSTNVLLRYSPLVDFDDPSKSARAPDLKSLNVEWRVHIFTQHMSSSLPIDLKMTKQSDPNSDPSSATTWKIPLKIYPGFRLGTHFLRASLLEFSQGCSGSSLKEECDMVRPTEINCDKQEESCRTRRLICMPVNRLFDVRPNMPLSFPNKFILKEYFAKLLESGYEEPQSPPQRRFDSPVRIVFITGLTNDGQSTQLFQLLPSLLSEPESFQVSVMHPKQVYDQFRNSNSNSNSNDTDGTFDREIGQQLGSNVRMNAFDWSLDAQFRINNKRHVRPATDTGLLNRARKLLNTTGKILSYEMSGWTVDEFDAAGGLEGVVERLQNVPSGMPEQMENSDWRSLKTLIEGLNGADIVHYTHVPEQALQNQLIVQSARIAGVRKIVCEPGRWRDETFLMSSKSMHLKKSITNVLGPSLASCVKWFTNNKSNQLHDYANSVVTSSRCDAFPIGADVDLKDIGHEACKDYRTPFGGLVSEETTRGRPKIVISIIGRLAAIKSPGMIMQAAAIVQRELHRRKRLLHKYLHEANNTKLTSNPERLPQFVFEFWGDGPLLDLLADILAPELGLHVRRRGTAARAQGECTEINEQNAAYDELQDVIISFEGWISHDTIQHRLQTSVDAVMHSTFEETYCVSNVEALAAGRVLITFGTAGVTEYLSSSDKHGIVVGSPLADSLASALWKVVDSPQTASAIGRAAEDYVRESGLLRDETIKQNVEFFRNL